MSPKRPSRSSEGYPPPPWLQDINDFMHTEPYSIVIHGVVWVTILLLAPLAAVFLMVWTMLRLLLFAVGYSTPTVDAKSQHHELAVVITGCDSGFGLNLALACHAKGYHVFASCLKKESCTLLASKGERIYPLVADVCNDQDVSNLRTTVLDWIKAGEETKKPRFLHAVVNNAGIGTVGLVDWIGMESYQKCMDVNCVGQIRVVKAFLPFLKDQYASPHMSYKDARIVNMVSMAGMVFVMGVTPYTASKFAAEGFSNSLRLELRDFGIKVITVNPSFHETPLTMDMLDVAQNAYDDLPEGEKSRYGQDYLDKNLIPPLLLAKSLTWRSSNVERDLCRAIDLVHPKLRYVTGLDARFLFLLQRMLPDEIQQFLIPRYSHPPLFFHSKEKQN